MNKKNWRTTNRQRSNEVYNKWLSQCMSGFSTRFGLFFFVDCLISFRLFVTVTHNFYLFSWILKITIRLSNIELGLYHEFGWSVIVWTEWTIEVEKWMLHAHACHVVQFILFGMSKCFWDEFFIFVARDREITSNEDEKQAVNNHTWITIPVSMLTFTWTSFKIEFSRR